MVKAFELLQNAIKSCNVFTSPVNLRYKLDPDYNTVAGGMVSIILVILLMSVFFNAWKALLNKEDISSSTEVIREFDPTYMSVNTENFMFAIGVNGINLTDTFQKKYFQLSMTRLEIIKGQKTQITEKAFSLEPCTLNHWQHFGTQFVQTFQRQNLNSFLCVPRNTIIDVAGKWTSQKFVFFKISFDKCLNSSVCRSQTEINEWVSKNTSFFFNFFYSNVLLNPDQKQPISMFLQDKDFTMFSPNMAAFTNLYLGEYTMETDESIFPWIDFKVDSGFILNRAQTQTMSFIPSQKDAYCQLFLRKSNTKMQIERKYRKLDDMLSYIGGLFGIITVAFGVIMKYYGQCSFELEMCQKIFDYHNKKQNKSQIKNNFDSQSQQITQYNFREEKKKQIVNDEDAQIIEPKCFGFLDFFLYILFYVPLKGVFNFEWRKMQIYEESLEEMRCKLDISQLMEKFSFYDRSINALFDENQLKLLYLQEKFNFQEVRDQRKLLEMREGLLSNLSGSYPASGSNITSESQILEYKKSLKQIAQRGSRRYESIVGPSKVNNLEYLMKAHRKGISQKDIDVNLPQEIKNALKKLDTKIEKGDVISTRIYNGLQYELLEAFEKSKMNKNHYSVATSKKIKKLRTISNQYQDAKIERKISITSFINSSSIASLNQIKKSPGEDSFRA